MKTTSYELEACRTNPDLLYVCFHTITSKMARTDKQAFTNLATQQHYREEHKNSRQNMSVVQKGS